MYGFCTVLPAKAAKNGQKSARESRTGERQRLLRRALEGEQVPVYDKGKVVGHTTRKSDALLVFAIKNLLQGDDESNEWNEVNG